MPQKPLSKSWSQLSDTVFCTISPQMVSCTTPSMYFFHEDLAQLMGVLEDWSAAIWDDDLVYVAYLDFAKVFDSVPHR